MARIQGISKSPSCISAWFMENDDSKKRDPNARSLAMARTIPAARLPKIQPCRTESKFALTRVHFPSCILPRRIKRAKCKRIFEELHEARRSRNQRFRSANLLLLPKFVRRLLQQGINENVCDSFLRHTPGRVNKVVALRVTFKSDILEDVKFLSRRFGAVRVIRIGFADDFQERVKMFLQE